MRVYISVDAEGISGIVKLAQVLPGRQDYEFCRKMMAEDVNAAIRGAYNAGATEVIINDAHNFGDNILIDQLDSRAKLISGVDRPFAMMQGIDMGFDAALFVGYHAKKGCKGVISHTYHYNSIVQATINKKPVAEYELNGLLAGSYNVPIVFVSGDNELVNDAKDNIPGVYTTITKEAIGNGSALCYHPDITHLSIEKNVEEALNNYRHDNIKPMTVKSDKIELEIQFSNHGYAVYASMVPGFEIITPLTVKFTADNYLDVFKAFITSTLLASAYKEMD